MSVRVRYRPVRFGWCVRDGNLVDVRRALHITHTLWGGRYNPIIPVGHRGRGTQLVEAFRVDALWPAVDDPQVHEFIGAFPFLPWPGFHKEFFIDDAAGKAATFLDICHPVRRLYDRFVKDNNDPKVAATLLEWDGADPLGDVFLACVGAYPARDEIGKDYGALVEKNLRGKRVRLGVADTVPSDIFKLLNPLAISALDLERTGVPSWDNPGLYVGGAANFVDIVNFWNLRASDIDLLFYDPAHEVRLRDLKEAYLNILRQDPGDLTGWDNRIAIWSRANGVNPQEFGPDTMGCTVTDATWNGLNVKPPTMFLEEGPTLAAISDEDPVPSLSFELPSKPFFAEPELANQRVFVSVRPILDTSSGNEVTFRIPYIPELNEYYGRKAHFKWNEARAEADGLGIVTSVRDHDLTIRGLVKRELVAKIFEAFGMKATPSLAGRVASRLIQQMGGIQGCRVFKIAGVRSLIEKYGPLQSFTKSHAVQTIGKNDPVTHLPNFGKYEDLHIEQRDSPKLKPENAFEYLLKRGVFLAGLNLRCSKCELEFWTRLDDLATEVECEYCGTMFNVSPQLRDRDWAYRRSGLFGRDDHQEGSIPVALTLQQLDTTLHWDAMFVTAMNVAPISAAVVPCETDFVLVAQKSYQDVVQVAVGECKAGGPKNEITEDDVDKLARVAKAFPRRRIETYVVFSKTGTFTDEEVARCRRAQPLNRLGVILLSDRELEPYFVYERTEKEFKIRPTAISLDDLARNTHDIFFEPKRKPPEA